MCGIIGVIGNGYNNESIGKKMLISQKHRGPNAMQYEVYDTVFLGHNRLSIIDLSTASNQPLISFCKRYTIIFNGEIYNYQELKKELDYPFITNSDTEVLLALFIKYKEKALSKLNGMFAFAIWDDVAKTIFLARDRFGVKPLYYCFFEEQFFFASEIKAFFEAGIPKNRNEKVWANYLSFASYGLPSETFWDSINQIPGGYFAQYSIHQEKKNEIKINQWYDFSNEVKNQKKVSRNDLSDFYLALLSDAIKLRFRADVPLGMNVSGGLDSSTLIALVNRNLPSNKAIEAFTFYCDNQLYDELPWVEKVIEKTNYKLNKVLLDYKKIPEIIEETSLYQDEPFGGFPTLAYSLLFKEAREKGIFVLLDGQGIDEAWAGYDYYFKNNHQVIQGLSTSPVRTDVVLGDFLKFAQKEIYEKPFDNELQNLQYRDLFYTKIPRALRFNDRVSMQYSTELREPFLDYRLVEFAFAQEKNLKFKNGETKFILRKIMQSILGDKVALAPKRPLQTPQREWIANELKEYVEYRIEIFSQIPFIDKKQVLNHWNKYLNGNQDNSFYIWQWINLSYLYHK